MTPPIEMASTERTLEMLGQVVALLDTVSYQIARAALAAAGGEEQTERLRFAMHTIDQLQKLFVAERARQSAPAAVVRES